MTSLAALARCRSSDRCFSDPKDGHWRALSICLSPDRLPLWNRDMQHTLSGLRHGNLIVYAVQYELASTPPSWQIVWPDSDGNSLHPWVRSAQPQRRIVTTESGDAIVDGGEPKTVAGVAVYRALGD